MSDLILVTGGAGFIGRFTVEELLRRGYRVRILDSLVDQVHGPNAAGAVNPEAELIRGDVRDRDALARALEGVESVIHLAAEVGVGQSMYEVEKYTSANELGTGIFLETLIQRPVRRIVTASSMSIYGEGLYEDSSGALVETAQRRSVRPGEGNWEPLDREGRPLKPLPTPEWKRPDLTSIYALGKYVQERQTLILSDAYGMEGVCLRLFNVYGPGQALSNPYTGVLAIFASRILNRQKPMIFEDGEQRRDFVYVGDVARAFVDALEKPGVNGEVFNIGSGSSWSVRQVGEELARAMGVGEFEADVLMKFRTGDIRHCFADPSRTSEKLGFQARKSFGEGVAELAEWVMRQQAEDRLGAAQAELESRGLVS